jgi:hypothetical protein
MKVSLMNNLNNMLKMNHVLNFWKSCNNDKKFV